MKLISRLDAARAGQRMFFTGKKCKYGHLSERYVSNGGCCQCERARALEVHAAYRNALAQA